MVDKVTIMKKKRQLIEMTAEFCEEHLNDEYQDLSEKLILKMSRKWDVPFRYGRLDIWAAAVVYSLGQINFLFDDSFEPYMSASDVCDLFGSNQSTTSQKAKRIRDMFRMSYFDSEFSTERMREENPLGNLMVTEHGLIIPINLNDNEEQSTSQDSGPSLREKKKKEDTTSDRDKKQKGLDDYQ